MWTFPCTTTTVKHFRMEKKLMRLEYIQLIKNNKKTSITMMVYGNGKDKSNNQKVTSLKHWSHSS